MRQRKREREGEREREKERARQRKRERQTHTHAHSHRKRERVKEGVIERERERERARARAIEGTEPQETRETRTRAQSPTQSHRIGLHGPVYNSKYAAGSPPRPAAAAGELFSKNVRAQEALERCSLPTTAQTAKSDSPGISHRV